MSKILVIEDNNDIREGIVEILNLAGYEVFHAPNGKMGVEIALKEIPEIVLCDIMMPEIDGFGVLHLLRKNAKTSALPFIFITAKSERPDLRKAMDMGADDYLTKPFDANELLSAIESRLNRKNAQQDFYSPSLELMENIVLAKRGLPELKKIIEERATRSFQKNQVVHYEGDRVTGVYLVISGAIKAVKLSEDGRELMTGIYKPNDFLGVIHLLSDSTYTYTATALEDSALCFFPKEQLEEMLRMYPDVAGKFMTILSNENRAKDSHLLKLAYQSVRKRIAESLLRMFPQDALNGAVQNITRDDLAALSGTASETVSRTLTEFKSEGLIEKKGSQITILDHMKISGMKN